MTAGGGQRETERCGLRLRGPAWPTDAGLADADIVAETSGEQACGDAEPDAEPDAEARQAGNAAVVTL